MSFGRYVYKKMLVMILPVLIYGNDEKSRQMLIYLHVCVCVCIRMTGWTIVSFLQPTSSRTEFLVHVIFYTVFAFHPLFCNNYITLSNYNSRPSFPLCAHEQGKMIGVV